MITAAELASVFSSPSWTNPRAKNLPEKAADIHVEGDDWVIREGEDPRFLSFWRAYSR